MQLIPKNNFFRNGFDLFDDNVIRNNEIMKTDLYEKDDAYYLEADLPGFSKKNIHLDYDNGYLTLRTKKETKTEEDGNYLRRERFYGQYERSFYVGDIKEADIKASYQEGVLVVTFPKEGEVKEKKQITVE